MLRFLHLLCKWVSPVWSQQGSVAASLEEHVVGAIDETVQGSLGQYRIREERVPVLWCAVGSDHHRCLAVSFVDELEHVFGLLRRQGLEAEVIDDQ